MHVVYGLTTQKFDVKHWKAIVSKQGRLNIKIT